MGALDSHCTLTAARASEIKKQNHLVCHNMLRCAVEMLLLRYTTVYVLNSLIRKNVIALH